MQINYRFLFFSILGGAFLFCAVGILLLSNETDVQSASSLSIDPNALDLGHVHQGICRTQTNVTNIGSEDINILYVTKGCDCASVKILSGPLKPGEKRNLDVEWDTTGRRGSNKTEVAVVFLQKGSDKKEVSWLSISSEVIPEFDIFPDRLEFDQNLSQTFTVSISSEKNSYRIVDALVNHPAFTVLISEEGDSVAVSFSAEKWQEGKGWGKFGRC